MSKAYYKTYDEIKRIGRKYYNDKGFCAVVAVAVACGVGFGKAYHTLKRQGRIHGNGTYTRDIMQALETLGMKMTPIEGVHGRQVRTMPKVLGKGMFIVFIRGHVLTIRDGQVVDWTEGRAHRVIHAWKIEEA